MTPTGFAGLATSPFQGEVKKVSRVAGLRPPRYTRAQRRRA
jgi:hypothetical protein